MVVELETQTLVDELTADLQREVDEYNAIVQQVDQAKQQVALSEQDLFVRRGRVDQLQKVLQRLVPPTSVDEAIDTLATAVVDEAEGDGDPE